MSSYSQPLNTISYSQNSITHNQIYKPKYIHQSDDDKLNSTIDYQSNKLPLNLFHSVAQYNKMLITYGKNRKKNTSQITDGVITSLQYVNDKIFQKQIEMRAKAKQSIHQSIKPPKKSIDRCTCCCCHQFCQECASKQHRCSKIECADVKKAKQTIDNQIAQIRNNRKISLNNSIKSKKSNKNRNTNNNQSGRAYSSIDVYNKKNKMSFNDQSFLKSSKKHQNKDISHLVIKSLIQFNQKKRAQQLNRILKMDTQKARQQYIKTYNQGIRAKNLYQSRLSKSRPKQVESTKTNLMFQYWEQIKDMTVQSLKNDKHSKVIKEQLMNQTFNVYSHKQIPKRIPRYSKNQIEKLRKIHEKQAQQQLYKQKLQKHLRKAQIDQNLKSLQKQRVNRIKSCQKKAFNPTAQMIQGAFKNIIQPDIKELVNRQNKQPSKKGKQIFRNQKLKKSSK